MSKQQGFVKRFLTVAEVASQFSLSKSCIYEMVLAGKLKAWNPHGVVGKRGMRISVESVRDFEKGGFIDPLA